MCPRPHACVRGRRRAASKVACRVGLCLCVGEPVARGELRFVNALARGSSRVTLASGSSPRSGTWLRPGKRAAGNFGHVEVEHVRPASRKERTVQGRGDRAMACQVRIRMTGFGFRVATSTNDCLANDAHYCLHMPGHSKSSPSCGLFRPSVNKCTSRFFSKSKFLKLGVARSQLSDILVYKKKRKN